MGEVNVVVVGDNNVGKTSLCITFSTGQFPSLFTPMECNRVPHEKDVTVGSDSFHVKVTDTEGHEDYDATRPESYQDADVILLCFSISSLTSFKNVKLKWFPELKKYAQNVPILLVGCKQDTRHGNASKKDLVKEGMGKKLNKSYVECSALKNTRVNECFVEAVKVAKGLSKSGGCSCIVL